MWYWFGRWQRGAQTSLTIQYPESQNCELPFISNYNVDKFDFEKTEVMWCKGKIDKYDLGNIIC